MRKTLAPEVERCRTGGVPGSGPCGTFKLLSPVLDRTLLACADDGRDWFAPLTPPPLPPGLPAAVVARVKARWAGRDGRALPPPVWKERGGASSESTRSPSSLTRAAGAPPAALPDSPSPPSRAR